MMKSQSHKATKFVAVAHFYDSPLTAQDVGRNVVKSVSINPDTTIAKVFSAFWPKDGDELYVTREIPFRLELVPDEATIPEDPVLKRMKEGVEWG